MPTGVEQSCRVTKDQGAIISVVRDFLVTGLAPPATGPALAAAALAATGIPAYNDALSVSNPGVICKSLDVEIADAETANTARVTATYTTLGMEDGNYVFEFSGSLNEDVTNADAAGNLVTLSYTDSNGTTFTQSPEIPVQMPELVASATGIEATASITALLLSWIGYVNQDAWMGAQPGCWLCTNTPAHAHDLDASPPKYKITFEFQLKRKGWTPTVYFRDDGGSIPSDPPLVYNVGYKRIVAQGYRAFGDKFPST